MNVHTLYTFCAILVFSTFFIQGMRTRQQKLRFPNNVCTYDEQEATQKGNCKSETFKKEPAVSEEQNLIHGMPEEEYFKWFNNHVKPALFSYKERENILNIAKNQKIDLQAALDLFLKQKYSQ